MEKGLVLFLIQYDRKDSINGKKTILPSKTLSGRDA